MTHHWDDTIHALQNAVWNTDATPRAAAPAGVGGRILEPGWLTNSYPRCIHVGRCGGMNYHAEWSNGRKGVGGRPL